MRLMNIILGICIWILLALFITAAVAVTVRQIYMVGVHDERLRHPQPRVEHHRAPQEQLDEIGKIVSLQQMNGSYTAESAIDDIRQELE